MTIQLSDPSYPVEVSLLSRYNKHLEICDNRLNQIEDHYHRIVKSTVELERILDNAKRSGALYTGTTSQLMKDILVELSNLKYTTVLAREQVHDFTRVLEPVIENITVKQ